jgi:hypothetical protein
VAALEVWYDQKPEDDFNPGDPAIIVSTHEELAALLDRVSEQSARQPCPSIITVYVADDPYRFPSVRAGVGAEQGYVQVSSRTGRRATLGDDIVGDRLYDFQGHGEDVPLRHEVPLTTVRAVLAAYLDHDGLIPDDFPGLHEVR